MDTDGPPPQKRVLSDEIFKAVTEIADRAGAAGNAGATGTDDSAECAEADSQKKDSENKGMLQRCNELLIRTRDVSKYYPRLDTKIATFGGTVTGFIKRITTDEPNAKSGPGNLHLVQLKDKSDRPLVHFEFVGNELERPDFTVGEVYRFGPRVEDRIRLVRVNENSLFGVIDNSTRGKKPALKHTSTTFHREGASGNLRPGQNNPNLHAQTRDRWVPVAASKQAKDRAAVATAMAKLATQPKAFVELVSFMEVLTRGGRSFQLGTVVERQLKPSGEKLRATVVAVHPNTVHFSNFRDASGRPLVCFKATNPELFIVGQTYKSTALIKGTAGGPSQEGYQVDFRGFSDQYIFGVPQGRVPPPYGCAGGQETTNTRELAARRREQDDLLIVQSQNVSRYSIGQVLPHPDVFVQDVPLSDVKIQACVRRIKRDENNSDFPEAGKLFLGDFKHVSKFGAEKGRALLWYHSTHPGTFTRGKTYMSASLGRTFEFLCHDRQGNVFGYANNHLYNPSSRPVKRKSTSDAGATVPGASGSGFNPEYGSAPPSEAVKITRDQMIKLKKLLREQSDPVVIRSTLEGMKLLPVHQPHWNEKPPFSRMEFGYYGASVIEFASLHDLPSLPALQRWRYY